MMFSYKVEIYGLLAAYVSLTRITLVSEGEIEGSSLLGTL